MSKDLFFNMRAQGLDIDCSGALYQESVYCQPKPKKLDVTVTNFGDFYKAKLDGEKIDREKLFEILNIKHQNGMRLEHFVHQLEKNQPKKYKIELWEMDVA